MGGSDEVVSICPVYCSSWLGVFFHLDYCFFSKFSHIKFIIREPDFPEEWLILPEMVKWNKNGSKTCFFWIHWKDWSWIFTEFVLFGMFCRNPILEKILVSEIWAKVFYRQSFSRNFSLTMSLEIIYGIELNN